MSRPRKRITCVDGASISVQASESHYSSPRSDNAAYYTHVECGYPDGVVTDFLKPFAEDGDNLNSTVYPYVPSWIVYHFITLHGGIKSGTLPPMIP